MSPTLRALRTASVLLAVACAHPAPGAPLRVATLNTELGLGAPATSGHQAIIKVLARLDADVVALQELQASDLTGAPSFFEQLKTRLGYPHALVAETSNVLDTTSRVAVLSRHPIEQPTRIAPPPGANDMVRQMLALELDVPETEADPTIITLHLKCCLDLDDSFRRAVELHRLSSFLEHSGLTEDDHLIVLGDFNLIGNARSYETLPAGLPASFVLGPDVLFPVEYYVEPESYLRSWSMTALPARQLDESPFTQSASVLDYILATPVLTSHPHASEIYNSALDLSNEAGLPKAGSPLPPATSGEASDHMAVFADFELVALPPLSLSLSRASISEDGREGPALLTINLPDPAPADEPVEVTIRSSDRSEVVPARTGLLFEPGVTTRTVPLDPQVDAVLDGDVSVLLTAEARGFTSAQAQILIMDASAEDFSLTPLSREVVESFDRIDGLAPVARWPAPNATWNGPDLGTSSSPGLYAYGPPSEPALGFLLEGDPISTTATFRNATALPVSRLQVSYAAEQWRSSRNGAADRIEVDLVHQGSVVPLPSLTFTADTSLPSGAIDGGARRTLSASPTIPLIQPGENFQLRFTATPGAQDGGAQPADVFLNEFHYDNIGGDINEFVEIVVAPGFSGPLHEISLVLYNGNGGRSYGTHSLSSFRLERTTASGHRIYSKAISGIQNGSPDGLALVVRDQVLHFLSYEGSFTATDGVALGQVSANIGVAQSAPIPAAGSGSLGLTGTGGAAQDFTWVRFAGPPSRGSENPDQIFSSPAGSQGIAIDDVRVSVLEDSDLDGLPDDLEALLGTDPSEPDSDQNGTPDGDEDIDADGQSNLAEFLLTQTDPLRASSRFEITLNLSRSPEQGSQLEFPSLPARNYTIMVSDELRNWRDEATLPGTGQVITFPISHDMQRQAEFYRVRVTLP